MSASRRSKAKELAAKREAGGYVAFPHVVLRSPQFAALAPGSVKLLLDLLAQYRGENNGDLCATMTLMRARGWRSKAALKNALVQLLATSFIVEARKGGRHKASLYAVTFFDIDYCGGKLDIKAPTRLFKGSWRRNSVTPSLGQSERNYPAHGSKAPINEANCPTSEPSQRHSGDSSTPHLGTSIDVPLAPASAEVGATTVH